MVRDIHLSEIPKKTMTMNPKRFLLWMFMVSIVMIFASLTSAYIVRQAEGNWLLFELPSILYVNTGVIIMSSIFMHWAYMAARRDNLSNDRQELNVPHDLPVFLTKGESNNLKYF